MTTFEVLVLIGLVILVGLGIASIVFIARNSKVELDAKLDAIDTRLSDNISIVNLAITGLREEMRNSSSSLREEISKRLEALGTTLQTTLGNIGSQQGEKLDLLSAEQTRRFDSFTSSLSEHRTAAAEHSKSLRDEVQTSLLNLGRKVADNLETTGVKQAEAVQKATNAVKELSEANERKQEQLKNAVEGRLEALREENARKLEEMRLTVDEKLQGTLEKRLGASFSLVNENLERVYKSVGEMQTLATGVGDLKRVLSNVKLRGTWGEGTLGTMLEQMLTPDQYGQNVEVKPRSGQRVEYAVKLPGREDHTIWVPIDCKMPNEDYERLTLAAEQGDAAAVEECAKALERRVLHHGKEISDKYICPPHTTDFAVLFLPTEGLFAEVVRRPGLADRLQNEFRISVTGPTTLMAFLHSLRMGFRTLAIQERSSEVWQVLGAVKTEFGKFGPVLEKVQKKLGEAQNAIEDAHKRRRVMDRKLKDVEALPEAATKDALALTVEEIIDDTETAEETAS